MTKQVLVDNDQVYIERREVPKNHRLSILDRIYIEPGTKEDWDLMCELHYKGNNEGIGPRRYKIVLDGQTIGVGTMTVPKMLLGGRNDLFEHLKPNQNGRDCRMINQHRAIWLNEFVCCNSRLVLDTMYRGAGIAYRAQNLMMRMTNRLIIEFQSSMSKYNPFAEKAGVIFGKPKRATSYEKGLKFFRRWFECDPMDFVGIMEELNSMPEKVREKCLAELRDFYFKNSSMEKSGDNRMNGTSRVDGLKVRKLVKHTQQLVFASPLYGIYRNPDCYEVYKKTGGRSNVPQRLPLSAFDNQGVNEPLDFSKLDPKDYAYEPNDKAA